MHSSTIFAIFAFTMPLASAGIIPVKAQMPSTYQLPLAIPKDSALVNEKNLSTTEDSAVAFTTYPDYSAPCGWDGTDYFIPDGQCSSLPGKWLSVNRITDTCRSMYNIRPH